MILGQPNVIDNAPFKGSWANSLSSALHMYRGAGATGSYRWRCFGVTLGHQGVVGSIWEWANPFLPVARLWNDSGPTQCHRQRLIQGELGQFPVIGIAYVQRSWANWKLSVVLLWGNSGPSRGRRQYLEVGQSLATGSTALE
jgi:hypothetical protein